jgi:hypothetical protein
MIDYSTLQDLSHGKAVADAACPLCGPGCKTIKSYSQGFAHLQQRGRLRDL